MRFIPIYNTPNPAILASNPNPTAAHHGRKSTNSLVPTIAAPVNSLIAFAASQHATTAGLANVVGYFP
jgi:hypothetical protein